jgi:hypothetical protein
MLIRYCYARRRPLATIGAALLLCAAGLMIDRTPPGALAVALLAIPLGTVVWARPRRTEPPAPAVPTGIWTTYDDRSAVWDERVGVQGGALPGSQLLAITGETAGWSATIALPPGQLTTARALAATDRIASAYSVSAGSIVVEPALGAEQNRARLLVLTTNPLRAIQPFTGPRLDHASGRLPIGTHADGTTAWWRLWTPGSGVCHGLIAGTTGSGKSGLVNLLCTEIRVSGVAVLWLADPEQGESVPDWQDAADWFAGTIPEIRRMLQAAERIMNGRKRRRARQTWIDDLGRIRRGRGHFDPTPGEPQLNVIIDESPDVLADPECRRIVALIGKKGRKLGVSVTVIAQVPSLAELGGDLTIRSMLSSTNIVMFRTSDKLSKQMGLPQDLPVNPANLPEAWPDGTSTAGLGYVASAGGRLSPVRVHYVQDPYYWATAPVEVAALEPTAVQDAGAAFATWRDRRGTGQDELEDGPLRSVPDPNQEPEREPESARESERAPAHDAILTALTRRERVHTGVLAAELDIPLPTASQTLHRLERQGLAHQVRPGIWTHAARSASAG